MQKWHDLFLHISGATPISHCVSDSRVWGLKCRKYSVKEGYFNENQLCCTHLQSFVWKTIWKVTPCLKLSCSIGFLIMVDFLLSTAFKGDDYMVHLNVSSIKRRKKRSIIYFYSVNLLLKFVAGSW